MAKLTIAQLREIDVRTLATLTGISLEESRKFFNSFYRLGGLEWRLLYMENDYEYYSRHQKYIERENERAYKWMIRLNEFLAPYGLKLQVSGGYCSVVKPVNDAGGISVVFHGWWYR